MDTSAGSASSTFVPPEVEPASPAKSLRVGSIDVYRGLVMFLMMAEVLEFCQVARKIPESRIWKFLCEQQSHVEWTGCVLHDMIQPSFSFLVGVALPFSIASRLAKGQTWGFMTLHALWRSLILIFLGVFLRSVGRHETNFTFEDTLSQIGLGYPFLFLLGRQSARAQWIAFVAILAAYWGLFAVYPLPGPDFNYSAVNVPADWPHLMTGFPAHWNKNSNPAWAFDVWFLNLFPRSQPFTHNGGGYATLSFIPTLATMILGLLAGGLLRQNRPPGSKIAWLAVIGLACLLTGLAIDYLGLCPIVKRIWTPSWVLFSGGICFLTLAFLNIVVDFLGLKAWAYPLRVIGANSIAAYCLAHLVVDFIVGSFRTHFGDDVFNRFGSNYEPFVQGIAILTALWLILFWMDRRKIYLRI